jgi:predicted amidophosphoribosyltransferase
MEECPICRASLGGADICRRCRAELGRVKEIERRAEEFAGEGMRALASGETTHALRLLRRALAMQATPEIRRLLSQLEANAGIETQRASDKEYS